MQADDIHVDCCTQFVHRLAAFQEYDAVCVGLTGQHAAAPALLLDRRDEADWAGNVTLIILLHYAPVSRAQLTYERGLCRRRCATDSKHTLADTRRAAEPCIRAVESCLLEVGIDRRNVVVMDSMGVQLDAQSEGKSTIFKTEAWENQDQRWLEICAHTVAQFPNLKLILPFGRPACNYLYQIVDAMPRWPPLQSYVAILYAEIKTLFGKASPIHPTNIASNRGLSDGHLEAWTAVFQLASVLLAPTLDARGIEEPPQPPPLDGSILKCLSRKAMSAEAAENLKLTQYGSGNETQAQLDAQKLVLFGSGNETQAQLDSQFGNRPSHTFKMGETVAHQLINAGCREELEDAKALRKASLKYLHTRYRKEASKAQTMLEHHRSLPPPTPR